MNVKKADSTHNVFLERIVDKLELFLKHAEIVKGRVTTAIQCLFWTFRGNFFFFFFFIFLLNIDLVFLTFEIQEVRSESLDSLTTNLTIL